MIALNSVDGRRDYNSQMDANRRKTKDPKMYCPRCRTKMQVEAHRPHKHEKWCCPQCRTVRMKPAIYQRNSRNSRKSRKAGKTENWQYE